MCENDGCTVTTTKTKHSGTDDGDCTTPVICECGEVVKAAEAEHIYDAVSYTHLEALSDDITEQNKAYAKKQGIVSIIDVISQAFSCLLYTSRCV